MATPFVSDQSSRNVERVCQVEASHQEQPNVSLPRPAAKKRVVGFDCEFVERPTKAFQVDCPICLLVLRESHQATCCGYSYCQPCIERVQFDKKPCPTCNTAEFSVFPNKGFQRSLNELHVRCSHEKDGCQWTGELGELDKHLNESPILGRQFVGCEFAEVECNDCGKSFQRQHFKAHQLEQHPFSCEYCHDYESYYEDVVKNHRPVCGFYPVPCPNECGVYPERQNLEHHVSKDAGCEVQLIRQDLPAHLTENLVPHMAQLATYNQKKVQEKDQQILQLTEDLKQEMDKNCQNIDRLERENEALKQEIAQLQEDDRVKEEATRHENELLKQEIAQLQQHMHKKDEVIRQEIVELKQEQQEEAQKKDETLRHEIAALKRRQEDAVSKEEGEAIKQEIAELRETSAMSKEENDALSKTLVKLQEDDRVKEDATRHENELLKQEIAQLRQKQDDATSGMERKYKELQEHMYKKDEAVRQELQQEQQESESKMIARLKSTAEDTQKKDETLRHEIAALKRRQEDAVPKEEGEAIKQEIAELRETSAMSKEENDALSKSLLKLQEDNRVKEEATRHENELLKQEIAQLRQKQDDATSGMERKYKELQEHMHKKDEAVRQQLQQEQQESESKMIARLKSTEVDAQKKDETLRHEIAALKRRQEDAVSKEEGKAVKQEIAELRETSVSKEENEAVKQEVIQIGKKQKEMVSKEDHETTKQELTQLKAKQEEDRSSLQTLQSCNTTPPIEFTMTEFEKHKRDGDEWFSEPFYTHHHGYKMCLSVDANGYGAGESTHVSVFYYLMRGKYDDHLRWPFASDITVQLMNHLEDKEHYTCTACFRRASSSSTSRVTTGERAT